jgi:hypothetical protein
MFKYHLKFILLILSSCHPVKETPEYHLRLGQKSKYIIYSNSTNLLIPKLWAKGTISNKNTTFPVKVKLRGDLPKHTSYNYSSFEIKKYLTSKRNTVIEHFSLIRADDKLFFIELLPSLLNTHKNLYLPKTEFVTMRFNSESKLYIKREDTTKIFLEKRFQRASTIYKLTPLFNKKILGIPTLYNQTLAKHSTPQLPILEAHLYKEVGSKKNYFKLNQFIKSIQENDLRLLNKEHYAYFTALQLVVGSNHASQPDNIQWFYNHEDNKFSPIIYDLSSIKIKRTLLDRFNFLKQKDLILKELSKDSKFIEFINKELQQIKMSLPRIRKVIGDLEQKYPFLQKDAVYKETKSISQHNFRLLEKENTIIY